VIAIQLVYWRVGRIYRKRSFLYCVSDRVYRALAWQHVDQIRYNNKAQIKYNVNLSLCLISYAPRQDDTEGDGDIAPPFLTSALDGGKSSASRPSRFIPRERVLRTHRTEGWVGPRTGLNAMDWRKISCLCREPNPGRQVRSSFLYRLSYPGSLLRYNTNLLFCPACA
jgi:hypothetical protein